MQAYRENQPWMDPGGCNLLLLVEIKEEPVLDAPREWEWEVGGKQRKG